MPVMPTKVEPPKTLAGPRGPPPAADDKMNPKNGKTYSLKDGTSACVSKTGWVWGENQNKKLNLCLYNILSMILWYCYRTHASTLAHIHTHITNTVVHVSFSWNWIICISKRAICITPEDIWIKLKSLYLVALKHSRTLKRDRYFWGGTKAACVVVVLWYSNYACKGKRQVVRNTIISLHPVLYTGPLNRPSSGNMYGRPQTAYPQTREHAAEVASHRVDAEDRPNSFIFGDLPDKTPRKQNGRSSQTWSPQKHHEDRDSDELSLSTLSSHSSVSLASEVLERAKKRRDDFWGKKMRWSRTTVV